LVLEKLNFTLVLRRQLPEVELEELG